MAEIHPGKPARVYLYRSCAAQDAMLFEGTLRENLDPSRCSNDADILGVLSAVAWHQLEVQSDGVDHQSVLDQHIFAGGTNLSAGAGGAGAAAYPGAR